MNRPYGNRELVRYDAWVLSDAPLMPWFDGPSRHLRRLQWVALAILVGLTVVLLCQTLGRANQSGGYDFTSYLISAKALLDGGNPYSTEASSCYIYPLFLAFLLIPLTFIPYWLANVLWFALSVTCLCLGCLALVRIAAPDIKTHIGRRLAIPSLLVFLIMFSPLQNNLLNGQVNLIVLFCSIMFLDCFTRGRGVSAAAWLGGAIALKLLPVVLLAFLLMRKQYRLMAWTVFFAALFCTLPVVVAGSNLLPFYKNYVHTFLVASVLRPGAFNKGVFFGFQGLIEYFTAVPKACPWVEAVSLLATAGTLLAIELGAAKSSRPRRDVWPFCAYMLSCLLISPAAEIHHLVLAIPAVYLLALEISSDRRWATRGIVCLAAVFILCFDIGAGMRREMPFYCAALIMLLSLVFLAGRQREPAPKWLRLRSFWRRSERHDWSAVTNRQNEASWVD